MDDMDSKLEQDIMRNLANLRETWMNWNTNQQGTSYKVVSSEQVRDTSLNIESVRPKVPTVRDCAPSLKKHHKTRERKVTQRRKVIHEDQHTSKPERDDTEDFDMLNFVRQHRDQVKRFVLENEKSYSNLWKQTLEELGVRSKKKSKVPFPIFLGMQRKQKQRRARLLSKRGSATKM
ncbi:hypothetical protein GpartN1_g4109.t1 [Galdieria partita]|uniref:Uncharacterized protein n=1 Tax=Galdieria partita TaxID=83374 RepID=A0A9C7PWY8_9RHOD|nr:hypothetical protein GpartN1_g4109.t1 [Galdieria partita]